MKKLMSGLIFGWEVRLRRNAGDKRIEFDGCSKGVSRGRAEGAKARGKFGEGHACPSIEELTIGPISCASFQYLSPG